MDYVYLGDKMTSNRYSNEYCKAVRRVDGKCIRSRMGTMLVEFENGKLAVVLARRLRKIHRP